jgi:hypothetical protein
LQTSPLPLGYRAMLPRGKSLAAARLFRRESGAGDGGRTRDIDLGKVALYH